jgi:hypothetical protein
MPFDITATNENVELSRYAPIIQAADLKYRKPNAKRLAVQLAETCNYMFIHIT